MRPQEVVVSNPEGEIVVGTRNDPMIPIDQATENDLKTADETKKNTGFAVCQFVDAYYNLPDQEIKPYVKTNKSGKYKK